MLYRRILSTNSHQLIFWRKLSLSTEHFQIADDTYLDKKTKKNPKKSYFSKEVYDFLKIRSPQNVNLIPKTLIRKANKHSSKLYIIDDNHAKALASMISKELLKDVSHVIESSPGLGLLTKELLIAGVPFIHLHEIHKPFYEGNGPLSVLMKHYSNRLKVHDLNFSKVWKLFLKDKIVETKDAEEYLADVPYCKWKSNTYMQVIDFSPTRKTITLIVYNFFNQTNLFERGRPCFYIGAPGPRWNKLIKLNGTTYSQYSVILDLFFDIKHLGELPRDAFIPWPREKHCKLDNLNNPIHIVKLEPKRDVYDILAKDDIQSFWFFLKYCLKTSKNKVLDEFEKLVPGSGVKLIQQDCGILTTFKELPPKKLLEIFKMYRSWPEYDEVMFNPSLSTDEKKNDEKLEEDEEEEKDENESLEECEQKLADKDNRDLSTDVIRGNG